jgi:Domain of unknown function (DUF5610)
MAIKPVGSQTTLSALTGNQKTQRTQQSFAKKQAGDRVSFGPPPPPTQIYAQQTLNALQGMVDEAAAAGGVDLAGFDPSPEGVSDMIVGFVVGNFPRYQAQHPEMSEAEAMNKYEDLIGGAINKGYNEALEIIQGMGIDDDKTMSLVQRTHDLIFEKLDQFFADGRARLEAGTDLIQE